MTVSSYKEQLRVVFPSANRLKPGKSDSSQVDFSDRISS